MLLLLGAFLLLMLVGLPVALAMAVASLVYILVTGIAPDVIAGAAHDRRRRELSAARGAVLHPGRQPDEHRRRHRPHLHLRGRAGRLDEGRARPGQHHRLGDLLRHVRHRDRRRRRHRHDRDQGDEGPRLPDRVRGRRHRRLGDARADHPAVAALRHLRHDGERLDRRAVPRRRHPRRRHDAADDGDRRLSSPTGTAGAATRRSPGSSSARRRSRSSSCWLSRWRSGCWSSAGLSVEHRRRHRASWCCWRSTGISTSPP